jgi:hypothetical protein
MPSFKDSNNPALNPELAIKKELMRRTKDANRATEGAEVPSVSQQIATPYGDLYKTLTLINAHYAEVTLELDSFRQLTTIPTLLTDRFKGSSLALSQSLKMGNALLKRMKYDLSGLSDDELRGIQKEYNEMKANEVGFEADLASISALARGAPTDAEMDELRAQEIAQEQYGTYPEAPGKASTGQRLRQAEKRRVNLAKQFATWRPEYQKFVKSLGDALKATQRVADVVGSGYIGGLMPSHYAITTASLPRRFI